MGAKVAQFFLLDQERVKAPSDYGMKLPVASVAPFYEVLEESCSFTKISYSNCTVFSFGFFDKANRTHLLAVVRDQDHNSRSLFESKCRARVAELLNTDEACYDNDYMHMAVWMPRGLKKQEFLDILARASGEPEPNLEGVSRKYLGNTWVMNYHRGYLFGGNHEMEFARTLALYGLGLAYHHRLSGMINRLSKVAGLGGDQLTGALLDIQRFQTQYLFDNPVLGSDEELHQSYHQIVKGLGLDSLERQLRTKQDDLMRLVDIKRSRDSIEGGLGQLFHRQPAPQGAGPQARASHTGGAVKMVLGVLFGVVLTAGLLASNEQALAVVQGWLQ